jgi:phosphinothricin acetyltransferase
VKIRAMKESDADAVLAIYQEGIDTGHASFETRAPSWAEFDQSKLPTCRLVAEDEDTALLGWAALSPVSNRCVYGGVAELSVYVAQAARGKGLGRALLDALILESEAAGIWTLEAGVFPENVASLTLHERCGFEQVGRRRGLGKMDHGPLKGQWRDVIWLERRSQKVGV